jgi:mRNA-degrading endonuclease toxin of MazEF toxin-antitoxin module
MSFGAGDVAYARLDPVRGTGQAGTRPVIVISAVQLGSRVIVVPLTTTRRDWATRIRVNLHGIESDAMCEQVRTVDVGRLDDDIYGRIPHDTLTEVRRTVARLIGVY